MITGFYAFREKIFWWSELRDKIFTSNFHFEWSRKPRLCLVPKGRSHKTSNDKYKLIRNLSILPFVVLRQSARHISARREKSFQWFSSIFLSTTKGEKAKRKEKKKRMKNMFNGIFRMMESSLVAVKNFRCKFWVQDKHNQNEIKSEKGKTKEQEKSILLIKFRSAKYLTRRKENKEARKNVYGARRENW